MNELKRKLDKISNEIIVLFCSGTASSCANKDIIEYKPDTVTKLNELLVKRNLLIELIKEQNAKD